MAKIKSTPKKNDLWNECNNCGIKVTKIDIIKHKEDCPINPGNTNYFYIKDKCLLGDLHINESTVIKSKRLNESDHYVFLSESCMKNCDIPLGGQTIINVNNVAPIVKSAWPTTENKLTSVHLTKSELILHFGDIKNYPNVSVAKFTQETVNAKQMILASVGKHKTTIITKDIASKMSHRYRRRILTPGNRISIFHCGKFFKFSIKDVIGDTNQEDSQFSGTSFFEITRETKWILANDKIKNTNRTDLISEIKGLDEEIAVIRNWQDSPKCKSVLLYGDSGTGKTKLAVALAGDNAEIIRLETFLHKENAREILSTKLESALHNGPAVIVLDEIDKINTRLQNLTETEKKIQSLVWEFFYTLSDTSEVFIIGTTNKTEYVDVLWNEKKFQEKIKIPIPNPQARREIIGKLLNGQNHNISESDLSEIMESTHGYVGRDLERLCNIALHHSKESVDMNAFKYALKEVKPEAMEGIQQEFDRVNWSDIAGQEELKTKLKEAVEWPIKYPDFYKRTGIKQSCGVLMYGPPGCSKTMIAKALATECNWKFFSVKGPELLDKYVGESERKVRDLFERARKVSPSIIFFDEIDSISGNRTFVSGNEVGKKVLSTLLNEMDGMTAHSDKVMVVAATNRPDLVDDALLRPGRLDLMVYIPLPDRETRMEIFKKKNRQVGQDVDLNLLVNKTENYSGAEIVLVHKMAAMYAHREDKNFHTINMKHFELALKEITPRTSVATIKSYENFELSRISTVPTAEKENRNNFTNQNHSLLSKSFILNVILGISVIYLIMKSYQ